MVSALRLSLQILAVVLPLLFLAGTALGWLLSRKHFPGKRLVTFLLHLPLVLPPTVMGLYLLFLLGQTPLLREMKLLFTLPAAMLAAFTAALPLAVTGARTGFAGVPQNLENAARSLGDGEWRVFFRISLPLARRSLFAGMALAAARALGEFGITLMIAGNMPGRTQTLPLYIYGRVEMMDFSGAHTAALLLVFVASVCLLTVHRLEEGRHELSH